MKQTILRLYKDLHRYGQNLRFTDKAYFRFRIRSAFKQNKDLTDQKDIDFQIQKAQKLLQNQRVI